MLCQVGLDGCLATLQLHRGLKQDVELHANVEVQACEIRQENVELLANVEVQACAVRQGDVELLANVEVQACATRREIWLVQPTAAWDNLAQAPAMGDLSQ